jgi:hypothetical protein
LHQPPEAASEGEISEMIEILLELPNVGPVSDLCIANVEGITQVAHLRYFAAHHHLI